MTRCTDPVTPGRLVQRRAETSQMEVPQTLRTPELLAAFRSTDRTLVVWRVVSHAPHTVPVIFRDLVKGWGTAVGVEPSVTGVTQEQEVIGTPFTTHLQLGAINEDG